MAAAVAYAAAVQALIYSAGPCYNRPLTCPASNKGTISNQVNAFVQIPIYVILGLGEIFFVSAVKEFAYNHSPPSMKSFVQALLSLSNAVGCALGAILAPVSRDPNMVVFYACLSSVVFCAAVLFFLTFRNYN